MIVVGGWSSRVVVGLNGRFGVRPADFATGGDFDNPLLDDVDPGDETTEFVAVVQALPGSGTVVFDDLGGFEHIGAADGTYTTEFTLYTWAQGGPVTAHTPDEEITTTFGDTDTAAGVTLVATASLVAGSASGASNATADGVTLTATASLLAGAASGPADGVGPGVVFEASASLVAGSASGSSPTQELEDRVAALEARLAAMEAILADLRTTRSLPVAGSNVLRKDRLDPKSEQIKQANLMLMSMVGGYARAYLGAEVSPETVLELAE